MNRRRWLVVTGAATVAFFVALSLIENSLPQGAPGIIQFEFVGSAQRAARYLSEWGGDGRDTARLSLWVDFGFMLSYGSFFALAALATRDLARERGLRRLAAAGLVAPFCAVGAACFDAAENVALLLILGDHGGSVAPPFATACASVKFVLIGLAIAYVIWGMAARPGSAPRAGR
jgi:hypothetical protein